MSPFARYQEKARAALRGEQVEWHDDAATVAGLETSDPQETGAAPATGTSPFRHNKQTVLAQLSAEASAFTGAPVMDDDAPGRSEYNALMVALEADLRTLSTIQSVDARNPLKREMATKFDAWVSGALAAGAEGGAVQDEILVTMMVWAKDYADFDRALDLAAHALEHGLALPERYKRNLGCFIAEDIAEMALKEPASVSTPVLQRTYALTQACDMPDQAKAKLLKALGRSLAVDADTFDAEADNAVAGGKPALTAAALDALDAAFRLDTNVGVKKDREALTRKLADLGGRPQPALADQEDTNPGA